MKKQIAIFLAVSALALSVQAQTVTPQYVNINAVSAVVVNAPNTYVNGSEKISGNLTVQGYTTLSGPNTTIGAGSSTTNLNGANTTVSSTYTSLNSTQTFVNGEKTVFNQQGTVTTINKAGISTAGSVSAAQMFVNGKNVENEIINLTNSVNSKASAASVTSLTNTVTNNAATAANATAAVQTNLNAEVTTRTSQVNSLEVRKADKAYVDDKIVAEENARIAGDVATLNAANTYTDSKIVTQSANDRAYTDSKIVTQSANDRAYTDQAVASERDRALAAEAALGKEIKQVGAMAMAAAGVAGATPAGDKKTAVTAAVGAYSGQTAIAVGVTHLVKENTRLFGAFSKVSGGKTGVTVGASFSF